jgi:hypothetical protein
MQSTSMRRAAWTTGLVVPLLLVASCMATQQGAGFAMTGLPGFWRGFWHGLVAPIAFVVSLFSDTIRIYATPNTGRWYDFGYMLGIGGFSGGALAGHRTLVVKKTYVVERD